MGSGAKSGGTPLSPFPTGGSVPPLPAGSVSGGDAAGGASSVFTGGEGLAGLGEVRFRRLRGFTGSAGLTGATSTSTSGPFDGASTDGALSESGAVTATGAGFASPNGDFTRGAIAKYPKAAMPQGKTSHLTR